MKFKCVIQLPGGGIVTEFITTNNLANLSDTLQEKFPKGKVLSILGDYDSGE